MDGINSFLDVEGCSLSKGDSVQSENRRVIRMVAVVGSQDFKVILVNWLRHKERKERRAFILFESCLFKNNLCYCFWDCVLYYDVSLLHIRQSLMN